MALVSGKDLRQPFLVKHVDGLAKAIEQVGVGRAWPEALGMLACWLAASAFSLTALKPRPGGIMRPFCELAMLTSTPHSSCLNSTLPRAEMVSTSSRAGWPAASMARRTAAMSEVTPVEVSLWTTQTALI